jgi:polar amino acid transport system substrate-binding protein
MKVAILALLFGAASLYGQLKVQVSGSNEIRVVQTVMKQAGLDVQIEIAPTKEILANVGSNKVDFGFGIFEKTSADELKLDFSHSISQSIEAKKTFWQEVFSFSYVRVLWQTLQQPKVTGIGLLLLAFVLVFAHILWFVDLGCDTGICDNYWRGIGQAIYFCFVSMSTVGYGDFTPKKPISRFFTIILICFGIAFFSNFMATLSATFVSDNENKVEKYLFAFPENSPYTERVNKAVLEVRERSLIAYK